MKRLLVGTLSVTALIGCAMPQKSVGPNRNPAQSQPIAKCTSTAWPNVEQVLNSSCNLNYVFSMTPGSVRTGSSMNPTHSLSDVLVCCVQR